MIALWNNATSMAIPGAYLLTNCSVAVATSTQLSTTKLPTATKLADTPIHSSRPARFSRLVFTALLALAPPTSEPKALSSDAPP